MSIDKSVFRDVSSCAHDANSSAAAIVPRYGGRIISWSKGIPLASDWSQPEQGVGFLASERFVISKPFYVG